jgi:hypothetical protein
MLDGLIRLIHSRSFVNSPVRASFNTSEQWEEHQDPKWRQHWIDKAKKWQDKIPEARDLLKKLA